MTDRTQFSVISTAESALKKLKKHKIPVYGCKKQGARFIFGVKDKHSKKVFAIFSKPCYNITVERKSIRSGLKNGLALRAGLILGALVFIFAAVLSDFYCLKIEVVGSGAYLKDVVCEMVVSSGGGEGKPFSLIDKPLLEGKILTIPQVTFCSFKKCGSVLVVDVETDKDTEETADGKNLTADADGKILKLVAICGTPQFAVGDEVKEGDILIAPYEIINDQRAECLCVGYAELECRGQVRYSAPDDSEKSIRLAYASVMIAEEDILVRTHRTEPADVGVTIVVDFNFLHRIKMNMK